MQNVNVFSVNLVFAAEANSSELPLQLDVFKKVGVASQIEEFDALQIAKAATAFFPGCFAAKSPFNDALFGSVQNRVDAIRRSLVNLITQSDSVRCQPGTFHRPRSQFFNCGAATERFRAFG